MAITAFLSRSLRLLNRGPGAPASLRHVPHSSIFSPTGLISNWYELQLLNRESWRPPLLGAGFLYRILSPTDWTSWCTELYNCSPSTFFLWASQIALIQTVHDQGYILIFLDRMHLLFIQVHFLFWQLGRVGVQYTTLSLNCRPICISRLLLVSALGILDYSIIYSSTFFLSVAWKNNLALI